MYVPQAEAHSMRTTIQNHIATYPRIGQRVRFTRQDHPEVPPGCGGMIDLVGSDNQFWIVTDCGGFFGWTSFHSWEPTGEPDEVLDPEYIALRTQAMTSCRREGTS